MNNRVCDLLGIRYPIIQGAMQWVSDASLVIAASNAGALGVLATAGKDKAYTLAQIQQIKQRTQQPFAVNITILSPTVQEVFEVALAEKVPFVVLTAGNPTPFVPHLKAAGIPFMGVVATVKQAVKMQSLGAIAVVVEGQEAGGHIGELTTMTLVPQVASAVDIPVIAAGGIADGRGLAAAMMLGAEAVQMGTAFLAATETNVHPDFKAAILQADASQVTVTGRRINHAVRCLDNGLAQAFREMDQRGAEPEAYEALARGAAYKASQTGDVTMGSVMVGQIVGLVTHEQSVDDIIQGVIQQYRELRTSLGVL